MKVLVREKIADSGIDLLRESFEVDLGFEMSEEELGEAIGAYDALLVRSATKVTEDLIGRAERLKVIGRAGTGVDNVDITAATRRGIVVANAPESNSVAAAEHTLALMLALCRNIPQAQATLVAGAWERSRFKGSELYGKKLGVIGFGRIGQLVARRAQSFEMDVVAYDKFVSAERFRELGVEGADEIEDLLGARRHRHPPRAEDARDDRPHRRLLDRRDEGRRPPRQLCARRARRPRRPARGPRVREARRRRPRRLPVGAVHRAPDLRPRRRRRHPASRRLDRRGPGPGRDGHRRTGHRGAQRRRRHQCRQHRRRQARGDGGARALRPALRKARAPRPGPRGRLGRARHRRVPGTDRHPRHPPARNRGPRRGPLRPHRGAGQSRQRATDGRGARDRADRDEGHRLRGLHRARHGPDRGPGGGGLGTGVGPRNVPYLVSVWGRASICHSPTTSRSSATPTSRG